MFKKKIFILPFFSEDNSEYFELLVLRRSEIARHAINRSSVAAEYSYFIPKYTATSTANFLQVISRRKIAELYEAFPKLVEKCFSLISLLRYHSRPLGGALQYYRMEVFDRLPSSLVITKSYHFLTPVHFSKAVYFFKKWKPKILSMENKITHLKTFTRYFKEIS